MVKVGDIIDAIEDWAPPSLAESWDNTGLMTGDPHSLVNRVIITLDVTSQTILSAGESSDTLIISHHPVIFTPLKTLSGNSRPVRIIREALRRDIAIYAAHTNLDRASGGVSAALADRLGISNHTPLIADIDAMKFVVFVPPAYTDSVREAAASAGAGLIGNYSHCSFTVPGNGTFQPSAEAEPFTGTSGELSRESEDRLEMIVPAHRACHVVQAASEAHPYEEMAYDLIPLANHDSAGGYGAVGELDAPLSRDEFLRMVADRLKLKCLRASGGGPDIVRRVAVLGGSGRSFIQAAVNAGADAFVTGDLGHHDFLDHGDDVLLVDGTHRGSELPVLETVEARLRKKFGDIRFICDSGIPVYKDIIAD